MNNQILEHFYIYSHERENIAEFYVGKQILRLNPIYLILRLIIVSLSIARQWKMCLSIYSLDVNDQSFLLFKRSLYSDLSAANI